MTMIDVKMEQSTESTSGTREAEMPGSEGTSSSSETVVSILESWHPPRPSDLARRRKLATNPPPKGKVLVMATEEQHVIEHKTRKIGLFTSKIHVHVLYV